MNMTRIATFFTVFAMLALPAWADWLPGDGSKMHYPQLPDPNGWDVDVLTDTVYDDFLCAQSGPIRDVHFWMSWKQDLVGEIDWIDISFHGDVPAGADLDPNVTLSHPDSLMYGDPAWIQRFFPNQFSVVPAGVGNQGWIAPSFDQPVVLLDDHQEFFQINIPRIDDPFPQQKDTVYWIGIHIGVAGVGPEIGWKTSLDSWNDDAAYYFGGWKELVDPIRGNSLNMAFVITPEPATLLLLAVGVAGVIATQRKLF